MKANKTSLIALGIIVLALGAYGVTHAQSILSALQPKVVVMGNYIEAPNSQGQVQSNGPKFGATATASDPSQTTYWTGGGSFGGDLTVSGILNATGNINATGSTTISYLVGGENTLFTPFNTASTTVCSIQNTSGQDRIVTSFFLNVNAATGFNSSSFTSWRGYASPARIDNGTTSTLVTLKQTIIPSSTVGVVYGGPVPGSYFASSSPIGSGSFYTITGLASTTPVMWYNGSYLNVTTTAVSNLSGNCVTYFQPFTNN